jgi:hypothetical protein
VEVVVAEGWVGLFWFGTAVAFQVSASQDAPRTLRLPRRPTVRRAGFFCWLLLCGCTLAGATTIDFEQYPALTQITNQYAGVTFTNALELTVQGGYDFLDFPPHSGMGVITNDPGADISIAFDTPQDALSVYYTDPFDLTFFAYDASMTLLGSFVGPANIGNSNQVVMGATGVSFLLVSDGTDFNDEFVLDDLTYEPGGSGPPVPTIPEPGSWALMGTGLVGLVWRRFRV